MRHGKEVETEQRMDAALRVDKNPFALRSLEIETAAAVARCYRAPYNTYGKVKAYIREWGRLPPEEYRLPRYKWQQQPRRGTRCRTCGGWNPQAPCPMLQLREAAGMRGSIIRCSAYRRAGRKRP